MASSGVSTGVLSGGSLQELRPVDYLLNRFVSCPKAAVRDWLLEEISNACGGDNSMIGSTYVRVHQHRPPGKGLSTMAA